MVQKMLNPKHHHPAILAKPVTSDREKTYFWYLSKCRSSPSTILTCSIVFLKLHWSSIRPQMALARRTACQCRDSEEIGLTLNGSPPGRHETTSDFICATVSEFFYPHICGKAIATWPSEHMHEAAQCCKALSILCLEINKDQQSRSQNC